MGETLYDGLDEVALRERLRVPSLVLLGSVGSTMDVAHSRAEEGAPAGTLIIADAQQSGRGRGGAHWVSDPGMGIWLTLIERPVAVGGSAVLSLRVGIAAAAALDRFAPEKVRLKWPNDLYAGGGKLAGILIEMRWQGDRPAWVAIGFGLNVRAPAVEGAGSLLPGTARLDVLDVLVPALRAAAADAGGELSSRELAAWESRDLARGRRALQPVSGTVMGVDREGALLVKTASGTERRASGSLVLAEEA